MQEIINLTLIIIYLVNGAKTNHLVEYNLPSLKFVKFLNLLNGLNTTLIIFQQGFEWFCMIRIIKFQKNKSFGEILFEIQNADVFLKFKRREKILNNLWKVWFLSFVFIMCLTTIFYLATCDLKSCKYEWFQSFGAVF